MLKTGLRLLVVLLPSVFYVACITHMIMIFMNHLKVIQKSLKNYLKITSNGFKDNTLNTF